MKKEDVTGIIVYLFLIVAAVIFGLTVLQNYMPKSGFPGWVFALFVLGAIAAGLLINAILFELAHLLGAKIGRYIVTSINVLGFCWIRNEDGKYKFKFKSFEGLTGETKIIPSENEKQPNPRPYLLFGVLFYAIELAIAIILFVVMQSLTNNTLNAPKIYLNVAYFVIILAFIGALMLIYNIIPLQMDPLNDGYKLVLTNNPKNREAYNELLRVEHEISLGHQDVEIKTFNDITNFTADLNLNKVYTLLNKNEFEEARVLLDQIVNAKNDISIKVYRRALAQLIYINVFTKELDEARALYDKEIPVNIRSEIHEDNSMVCLRASLLVEGLFDDSKSECLLVLQHVMKAYKHTQKLRKAIEVKLFNEAIKKVSLKHPKWEFEKYLLEETEDKKDAEK